MSLPSLFSPKNGCWQQQPDGQVMWLEQIDLQGFVTKLYSPLEIEGISRSIEFSVVFIREREDAELCKKIKTYWAIDYTAKLAENTSSNIVIKFDKCSRKFYVSDLTPLGSTAPLSIEENVPEILLSKSEPYKISQETATKYLSKWNYGYGRVLETANSIEFYRTV